MHFGRIAEWRASSVATEKYTPSEMGDVSPFLRSLYADIRAENRVSLYLSIPTSVRGRCGPSRPTVGALRRDANNVQGTQTRNSVFLMNDEYSSHNSRCESRKRPLRYTRDLSI